MEEDGGRGCPAACGDGGAARNSSARPRCCRTCAWQACTTHVSADSVFITRRRASFCVGAHVIEASGMVRVVALRPALGAVPAVAPRGHGRRQLIGLDDILFTRTSQSGNRSRNVSGGRSLAVRERRRLHRLCRTSPVSHEKPCKWHRQLQRGLTRACE